MGGSNSSDAGIMDSMEANATFDNAGMDASAFDMGENMGENMGDYESAMHSYDRPPDFFDDAGNPVYMGRNARQPKSKKRKILDAMGAMGAMGGMGGTSDMSGNASSPALGLRTAGQFYINQPWNIPNAHPEQVSNAWSGLVSNMFRGVAGGLK